MVRDYCIDNSSNWGSDNLRNVSINQNGMDTVQQKMALSALSSTALCYGFVFELMMGNRKLVYVQIWRHAFVFFQNTRGDSSKSNVRVSLIESQSIYAWRPQKTPQFSSVEEKNAPHRIADYSTCSREPREKVAPTTGLLFLLEIFCDEQKISALATSGFSLLLLLLASY